MKRGAWADDVSALQRKSKNGVIRTSVLKAMGVGAKTIVDRTAGGPWQRILPGLVLLHNGQPTRLQRNTAAVMFGGADAMLTGRAGLALHGFSKAVNTSGVPLLIPHDKHRKDVAFVEVERTWRLPEPTKLSGLPVAPLERCLLDAARRIADERTCIALIAEVIQRGAVDVDNLFAELNEGSGRGSAVPRRALRELSAGAHSVAEVQAQKLYSRSGLPAMEHDVDIFDESGEWICTTENWLDPVALAWEVDSLAFHLSVKEHEETVLRRSRVESTGIVVAAHLPRTIRDQPELVLADLRAKYEIACNRPRPKVTAVPRARSSYEVAS